MLNSIRKEPETPLRDAWHITRISLFVLFAVFFVVDDLFYYTETIRYPDKKTWLKPEVYMLNSEVQDKPIVMYGVEARHSATANFIIQTRLLEADGEVLCTGPSPNQYNYSQNTGVVKPWGWDAFTLGLCEPPTFPFVLCIRYVGKGEYGTPFNTAWVCSPPFDPNE